MKQLTRAEEEIMQILWDIRKGFVKDIIARMPNPKPAYNTVSTIVRILEKKGFVGFTAYGKAHEYYPLIDKKEYSSFFLKTFLGNYFHGSFKQMVSFFARDNDLNVNDVEELLRHVKEDLSQENNDQDDGQD